MQTFLSKKEIEELTGKAQRAKQVRWLVANNYYYEVNGAGEILVTHDYIASRFSGTRKNSTEPNFGWMQ